MIDSKDVLPENRKENSRAGGLVMQKEGRGRKGDTEMNEQVQTDKVRPILQQ